MVKTQIFLILFIYFVQIVSSIATDSGNSLKFLVVGGFDNDNGTASSNVEYFNPFRTINNCTSKPPYPQNVASACGQQNLFCSGGTGGSEREITKRCFELQSNVWTETSHVLQGRELSTCTYLNNGSFWLLGGLTDSETITASDTTEIMINPQHTFQKSTRLPQQMFGHCMSKINTSHVFIVGGNEHDLSNDGTNKYAYVVDTSKKNFIFHQLPPTLKYRGAMAACGSFVTSSSGVDSNELQLIVAGDCADYCDNCDEDTTTSEIFSTKRNTWIMGPDLPRGFGCGGYYSDKQYPLIMVGGQDKKGNMFRNIIAYHADSNSFEILPGTLKKPNSFFGITGSYNDENC